MAVPVSMDGKSILIDLDTLTSLYYSTVHSKKYTKVSKIMKEIMEARMCWEF
jgi:hypothetical protein